MEGMGQIVRLAIFGVASILTLLAYFLPWFRIDLMGGMDVELNAVPFRGSSGLEVVLCDGCPSVGTVKGSNSSTAAAFTGTQTRPVLGWTANGLLSKWFRCFETLASSRGYKYDSTISWIHVRSS